MVRYLLTAILLISSVTSFAQHLPRFDAECPDVHDPVMAQGEDGRYYVFSTGMGISVMSSADLKTWRKEAPVFQVLALRRCSGEQSSEPGFKGAQEVSGCAPLPAWTTDSVPRFHGHIWAPDISKHGDRWYLYYSCSSFGKNGSAIGLATNKTLDPKSSDFKWEDQGCVITSHRGLDDYNCIDPALGWFQKVSEGSSGFQEVPYLFFGSFWDGIQMVKLDKDLKTPVSKPRTVARRHIPAKNTSNLAPYIEVVNGDTVEAGENAIEAPFVIKHGDYYYLFVSWDYCCRGKKSTYKTVYGRSRNIEGPYLDKDGKDMAQGGGTFLAGPDDRYYGVGHCAAYAVHDSRFMVNGTDDGQWLFICHAYDIKKKGQSKLYIRKLEFTKDNWIGLER